MFLSLLSIGKGRSLTGFSLFNCFGHKSFHWWNKFLPNDTEQPQTQEPHLQPQGGILTHSRNLTRQWDLQLLCFRPVVFKERSIHLPCSPGSFRAIAAIYGLMKLGIMWICTSCFFPLASGCLRHCSSVVYLPSTASISS